MIEEYVMKHKNIPVITFLLDTERYEVAGIKKVDNIDRLPFIASETGDQNISYARELDRWLKHRGISESRGDYENVLLKERAKNGTELSVRSLGLALDDHFWIHNTKDNIDWEKVNYFDNIVEGMIKGRIYPSDSSDNSSNIHPDFSTGGNLIKGWVYDKKNWVLLKEGVTNEQQEPYNEVIVSKILDEFGLDHVKYSKKKLNGRQVSVCKCMTDKNTELLPAQYVFDHKSSITKDRYSKFIDICKNKGIIDVQEKIDGMIAIDFFIGNVDRHRRNFGILRKFDDLEWLKIAPLYDNGNALFFKNKRIDNIKRNIDSYCKWDESSNLQMLNRIKYPSWYNASKGNRILEIIDNGLRYNDEIGAEKRERIVKVIKERIQIFNNVIKKKPNDRGKNV